MKLKARTTPRQPRNERRPHLLRVAGGPEPFTALIAAAHAAGLRIGWLDLTPAPPVALPAGLAAAAAAGVLRAVAVAGGRSVAVKPMRGAAVLRDLLREHFRGCVLVLVAGGEAAAVPAMPEMPAMPAMPDLAAAPSLAAEGESWRVDSVGAPGRTLSMGELVAALRRSRPWS